MSLDALSAISAGLGMVMFILEAGRRRNQALNEKLRRLASITAEATQSLGVDKTLEGILHHLVQTLGASNGVVFLLGNSQNPGGLDLHASVGASERYLGAHTRISTTEPWVQKILRSESLLLCDNATAEPLPDCFASENLATCLFVRVPGKDKPLGLLGIGYRARRAFEVDEEHFLSNVANLLALTVQNLTLLESAADSRRQWRDTFDSIDDLIVVHATDGSILRTNRAFAERVHLEPVALVGKYVREVLRRGAANWTRCPYCEGVAGKSDQVDPSLGGYFLVSSSALHGSEGGRLGTIHVLKDFTSRRLAENKFRNLFEKAQEGVFIATPGGRLLDCNDALTRLYGFEKREDLIETFTPEKFYLDIKERNRWKSLLDEFGEVRDFEFRFRRLDGEIRTGHLSAFVTRDDSGAATAYQGFILDVTERKQAEVEIRRRNQELLALNAIGDLLRQSATLADGIAGALQKIAEVVSLDVCALYLLDDETRTLKLSASVGCQSAKDGQAASFELRASLLEQVRQVHATVLSGSAPTLPEPLRDFRDNERLAAAQVVVLWANDRIMGILLVGSRRLREFSTAELNLLAAAANQIAITIHQSLLLEETREAYDTLRRTQEQLLQSEKMAAVGQLISGVAHELNNPLTAILGYSQLLQSEEYTNPRGSEYLEKLYKQAQRTHHIVENLLSFARQHKPQRTPVSLNQILEDTLVLREYDSKLADIRIHRELDPNLPATGGDFHQLQQVFLNILNNAVDAVSENAGAGEIWIRTRQNGDQLCVEFTNNGPPVQNPHRVFDPFYTTKAVGKGTGLGLSICYGIVKEHGGEIQVRNLSRGVSFTVTLPLIRASALPRAEQPSRSMESPVGSILLVEQEEALLQMETEILRTRGIVAKTARSVWEAIAILKRESVDAAIMDAKIPGDTSTSALYHWIEQNRPTLAPRVVFTAAAPLDSGGSRIGQEIPVPAIDQTLLHRGILDRAAKSPRPGIPCLPPPLIKRKNRLHCRSGRPHYTGASFFRQASLSSRLQARLEQPGKRRPHVDENRDPQQSYE